jgi:hypothetical protein
MQVERYIKDFLNGGGTTPGRAPDTRDASFDYCFNYFQSFRERGLLHELYNEDNMQTSCLQVAFYLASWGMLRGRAFLGQRSSHVYRDVVRTIATADHRVWEVDVDQYDSLETRLLLMDFKQKLVHALGPENKPTDTLVTKIMLGVFANVPAYDRYFRRAVGVGSFNEKSLLKLFDYYVTNKLSIDSQCIRTLDFHTGSETDRMYTNAKIVDMAGFMAGINLEATHS